jgi:hypothetical protein
MNSSLILTIVGQIQQQQLQPRQKTPTITSSASSAAQAPLASTTSSLERKLDHLIAEVQALRMELQNKRKIMSQ